MKRKILLASVLTAVSISLASAQYQQPRPEINVSGSAEIKVVPDVVYISAGVETRDAQLDEAARQNNERVARALAFLKHAGVPDKDVQTDAMEVRPDYGSDNAQITPRFYRISKSIQIKLAAVTNLETIVTGLLKNGASYMGDIDFRTTELRKYRDEARGMALKAAKEKAVALCRELDVKCGKPLSINAQDVGGYYWQGRGLRYNSISNSSQNVGGEPDSGGDSISLGQVSVSASVVVSFEIK